MVTRCCADTTLTYLVKLYGCSPFHGAGTRCRVSARASVVGRSSLGERAVKHDSMFTVCLGVVAIQSMLEHAVEVTTINPL